MSDDNLKEFETGSSLSILGVSKLRGGYSEITLDANSSPDGLSLTLNWETDEEGKDVEYLDKTIYLSKQHVRTLAAYLQSLI
jgi:hypothetical protein